VIGATTARKGHTTMHVFYEGLAPDEALALEQLAKLLYELRENRQQLLAAHGAADEAALLAAIQAGGVAEHPGYESYLSALTLAATQEAVRADLKARTLALNGAPLAADEMLGSDAPAAVWLLEVAEPLEERCGECLEQPVAVKQDALVIHIEGGVRLEARWAGPDAYAYRWTWGDAELCLDTAPRPADPALGAAKAHLHRPDGSVGPAPVTVPGEPSLDNLEALVRALADDPLLGGGLA